MDCNSKPPSPWGGGWESVASFSVKVSDNPKPSQPTIDHASLYSSCNAAAAGGCGSASSGFGMPINGCSSKRSIAASMDSAARAGPRARVIDFGPVPKEDPTETKEVGRVDRTEEEAPPPPRRPGGSAEPLIGLKLGKRTYFEDVVCSDHDAKNISFPAIPTPAASTALTVKKARVSHQTMPTSRCQVEGCNADLASAKDYHRKHKVCEIHSKCPKVTIAGQERRFCQQCSRFHDLSEFDKRKRSCRRRLSDHNARRRKSPTDTIPLNSARLPSSFYDARQQMNLLLNQSPFAHIKLTNSMWESSCDFKLPQVKGSWIRSMKPGGIEGQLNLSTNELPMTVSTLHHDLDRLLPFKGTTTEVFNQGLEASATASDLAGAPDIRCALSLLSTGSWVSADLGPTSINQLVHAIHPSAAQTAVQLAHTSFNSWQAEQPLHQEPQILPLNLHSNRNHFQESQLLKSPYENTFFDMNHLD